jgi:hypothetical protein
VKARKAPASISQAWRVGFGEGPAADGGMAAMVRAVRHGTQTDALTAQFARRPECSLQIQRALPAQPV